mmetsp:Transcript_9503/g.14052  ORF Transcript_9503/g.14052 Transcript_9503/m.14052 type:complete len:328 (+) Transcript_9503:49-1032(+)
MSTKKNHNFSGFSSLPFDVYLKQLFAGGTAGCCAKSSVAWLERVKFLFQVNSPHYPYRGLFQTVRDVAQKEGLLGLWKGNGTSMLRVFPYAAIQFSVFENCARIFAIRNEGVVPWYGNIISGSTAGIVSVVFTYPLDLVRLRMAIQYKKKYTGVTHAVYSLYKTEGGYGALFKGMRPTIIGIIPYAGINFFTFETLKATYIRLELKKRRLAGDINAAPEDIKIPTVMRLLCGSIAGLTGQTCTYPIDVVRRRMQLDGYKGNSQSFTYNYRSTLHGIISIYKAEGWRALYKGLSINYIKAGPMIGISFTLFDLLKHKLGIARPRGNQT